jgi:serine-type D-Ala-D-Ala carboxypeptidase (penicillin-binding protein 5/6)
VDGMKTGYTESAGYCLVSSAEREGMRLIAVVLGTNSPAARAGESQALLNYGFRFYETQLLWEHGEVVANVRVWKGQEDNIDLIVKDPIFVTIPRGAADQLDTRFDLPDQLIAPVSETVPVAQATVLVGDTAVSTIDLYSPVAIPEGGLMQVAWDEVLLWFE